MVTILEICVTNIKLSVQECESFNVSHKIGQLEIRNSIEIKFDSARY